MGLIPCADGGTKISQWQPGEANFDHAVMQTKLAMRNSDIRGILWHQGESDCYDEFLDGYVDGFKTMIGAMRRQIGNEMLPVIIGELSRDIPKTKRWNVTPENIDRMHANFAQIVREVPNCALVSSEGLTLNPDGIHFDAPSLRTFGNRYFTVYKETFGL